MNHSQIHPLRLKADPARVVLRPFHLAWQGTTTAPGRAERLVAEVVALDDTEIECQLRLVMRDFESRHWQARAMFLRRFGQICELLDLSLGKLADDRKQLIGAYFCHEYSYAAAALMNPSIVPHPDQSGLDKHTCRVVMSLRAVGEGHISSIAFREGLVSDKGTLELAPEPPFATATDAPDLDGLYEDGPVEVLRDDSSNLSGTVIFPVTPAQAGGLEDLRLTHFVHDDGSKEYIGTYTAYSGRDIRSELLRTKDFRSFRLSAMEGDAARNKGMALFPRKIGGRYMMVGRQEYFGTYTAFSGRDIRSELLKTSDFKAIDLIPLSGEASRNKGMALFPRMIGGKYMMVGRQDGQNLFLLTSDDITHWDEGKLLMRPEYPWEFIQIGNCGPPILIDEGWLVLTHGVGAMRQYAIGAILLDRDDPSIILGRTPRPILEAEDDDRNGYVPNVVYTCGGMRVGDQLFMPYGISDSSIGFAFLPINDLLKAME
jgi:predicted GH43/DUF377 family glycosyl hydrolase